jgi:ankyrin repeat protein
MYSSYDVFDFLMSHPRIDINMQVPTSGDTALIVACGLGRHMCIRKLLCAKGINVNSQNHQGETALMYAANIGDDVIVRALFGDRHLNKELVNKYGKRAIDIAILRKRKNVIDILKNEN